MSDLTTEVLAELDRLEKSLPPMHHSDAELMACVTTKPGAGGDAVARFYCVVWRCERYFPEGIAKAIAFLRNHARDLIQAARENDRLRKEVTKLTNELSRVSSQLGNLRGSLAAVAWQGGPEATVAKFREENERLRAELKRRGWSNKDSSE